MNLSTNCTVRSLKRANNGMRIAIVELPDGTFGEAPAGDGLKKDDQAKLSITVGVQSSRLYPRWLRVERA
ncbi:hypothetical protein NMQ14_01110 [Methyloversatilis sp. XJ19-13]|uniref:hypothetical protein n=1 Tax=Methyloversatilis sp. XJ19-13 TaxID=2963430 RepID=UPI00211BE567|nr:hypothetical protein [Methyloversatilis sp. XJ19-13]MCQ9372842.1 hypothetical protein [Methyloversatilis sp. XJ19-13]